VKQVLQKLNTGKTEIVELPVPAPQSGMVLVRNAASLVSAGTERALVEFAGKSLLGKARSRPDLLRQVLDKARREGLLNAANAAFGRLEESMPLGYSSAGTIVELGSGVQNFRVGQRVACAGGNYAVHAEYVLVPQNLLAAMPDELDFESASFTTLGAIALHGFRLAEAQLGSRVAVIGLGLLGQLAASIAQAAGCEVLGIDLDDKRVALARKRGLKAIPRESAEQAALSQSRGQGFDAVLVCADTESDDPVMLAGEIARDRARVVAIGAVGLKVPRRSYYAKELELIVSRSYGPGRYDPGYEEAGLDYPIGYVRWTEGRNLQAFVDLLGGDKVDVTALISHRFPIEKATQAYDLIQSKQPFLGVVINYPGTRENLADAKRLQFAKAGAPLEKGNTRLGVLGAGNFARYTLLPALKNLRGLDLVGIASASGRQAADLGKRFGFRYASSDENEILKDKSINTVAVLTRHHLHGAQTLAALKAGKNVFCEKPLAISEKELTAIEKQLSQKSPILMVGYNRRFAPLTKQLVAFLGNREEPMAANYRVNAGPLPANHWLLDPAQGGGRLLGEGCHFIDYLVFLVGAEPVSVFAQALSGAERGQENRQVTLRFADGSLGTLAYLSNGDRSLPKERLEVFCGGKVAVLDDYRALDLTQDGRTRGLRGNQDKGHLAAWQAFLQAVRVDGISPIPYEQIFSGARATFAALRSLETGKEEKLKGKR
jgi:predicted dehydrogenase/threonine dehydrogenase-like Zn-dependent dehydrogenase